MSKLEGLPALPGSFSGFVYDFNYINFPNCITCNTVPPRRKGEDGARPVLESVNILPDPGEQQPSWSPFWFL